MQVTINGQPKTFTAPLTLYDILEQEEVIAMMIAVAHNMTVIPKDQWHEKTITDGDQIEIVAPMQGG